VAGGGHPDYVDLAWNGLGYGLVWTDRNRYALRFARASRDLSRVSEPPAPSVRTAASSAGERTATAS